MDCRRPRLARESPRKGRAEKAPRVVPRRSRTAECPFQIKSPSSIYIDASDFKLRPIEAITLPYPGLPTDLQAQLCALMTQADGISIITERIYPERFMHVPELARMGANIAREGPSAIISGGGKLSGAPVMASDLRGVGGPRDSGPRRRRARRSYTACTTSTGATEKIERQARLLGLKDRKARPTRNSAALKNC